MSTLDRQEIFRKNYTPSAYLIETTELSFNLTNEGTTVSSRIVFYHNPNLQNKTSELFLDGVSLELLCVSINGGAAEYELKENGLLLSNLPERFVLEIENRIHPETNTSLNGLYQSSGNFCTQCEAEGFRQITYYLDRPDVLSVFTTIITANRDEYPVLLSNGNLLEDSESQVVWHDPAPKPCYLFALVAGKLDYLQDSYTTVEGRKVDLRLYVEPHNMHKTKFAMASLINAFAWEESRFGLCYDLDIYMIVAVDDFNAGAMENKGLNIFNSACVLANEDTTTDKDFINIESIIGHEYFHNWTGNRVTCRDWFQLSLKEGLTVFRDQEFTSDLRSRSIQRITDVVALKTYQFAEDAGPMAHPVRPESYIEMNNFYTATVYNKGAEVIRMIHTILGEVGFQKGMALYFERHDGDAVTIDDFVASMADANQYDFNHFMQWYSRSGTPEVVVSDEYDAEAKTYRATFKQDNQDSPLCIPNAFALLDTKGRELASDVVIIDELQKTLEFNNIESQPIASWFRGFSAPIRVQSGLSFDEKLFLCVNDSDAFNRWDSAQSLWLECILSGKEDDHKKLFLGFGQLFESEKDFALFAEILNPPSENILYQSVSEINVSELHSKRNKAIQSLLKLLKPDLLKLYAKLDDDSEFELSPESVGKRALKNLCLWFLAQDGEFELAFKQFNKANCMSDRLSAFNALLLDDNTYQDEVIECFYSQYSSDVQVMDKWFAAQSLSPVMGVDKLKALMQHKLFALTNPNRVRSVLSAFSQNHIQFHTDKGYQLVADSVIELDRINPQMAASLVNSFNHWRRFSVDYSKLQRNQLERISSLEDLSSDVYEIVNKALA
ncbi:MAG: aminopeptidase N [Gammaproteobacteria bacterium]|nr:aminopeptidase N [Gammaproteobacteria bacterium]